MKRKIADNLKRVQGRIAEACHKAGSKPEDVTMVAVTKKVTLDIIRLLVDAGIQDLGENRVQELAKRAAMVNEWLGRRARDLSAGAKPRPRWHMVGHLQRNKVKAVLPWIDIVQSVDSLRLAEELDTQGRSLGRTVPILLQVNTSGETSKQGIAVAAATHLVEQLSTLENIEVRGLMAMAPLTDDERIMTVTFERCRELFDEIVDERISGPTFNLLSMGMSNDYEVAIKFGANVVRIGSALFEGIEIAQQPVEAE